MVKKATAPAKKAGAKSTKAKAKAKTKAKAKVVVKPKDKPVEIEVKVVPPAPAPVLTKAEEFYIENNLNKSDDELALDLGKSLPTVRQHIHQTKGASRIRKLLIQEKGCTIMTEGASSAADNSRKGYVSQQAITEAVRSGNYEEAARLQAIHKTQLQNHNEEVADSQAKYIHRIER